MKKILLTILIIITPLLSFPQAATNDFGDAPESYGSADHIINNTRYLGYSVDAEAAQQYSSDADGDDLRGSDDEDGVTFPDLIQGTSVTVPVRMVTSLLSAVYLNVWIDWNGDGDFADSGERIVTDYRRTSTTTYNMSVTIPANAYAGKPTFARFRLGPRSTSKPVYTSTGSATFGEVEDYMIKIICAQVNPPKVSEITQPDCKTTTGSVLLEGLPAAGTWTLTRIQDGETTTGTGTSTTITGLEPGTWNYTVTNASGCTSVPSENIVILPSPATPAAPLIDEIIQPTCTLATGRVLLTGLPATGTWTLTRYPDMVITSGTGSGTTVTGLQEGTYYFTVANSDGCTSPASSNAVINAQPVTPAAPTVGTITQPTCEVPTGSVVLSGLPTTGTWTLIRSPGGTTLTGTGTSTTVTGLEPGTWSFTVTNEEGCTSLASQIVVINSPPAMPAAPTVGTITQPTCQVFTGSVVLSGLPASGTWTLTRSPGGTTTTGTGTSTTISGLNPGTWTYTVTNAAGCTSAPSADIVILAVPANPSAPVIDAIIQPTCTISTGSVVLTGLPSSGTWTLTRYPDGATFLGTGISSTITGLGRGTYTFTVTSSAGCTSALSSGVVINQQPPTPTAPIVGTITHPTCEVPGGTVILNGLPAIGAWTLTRLPGSITSTGTGTSTIVSGLEPDIYYFYVTNAAGCTSTVSANVVINPRPGPVPTVLITNPGPVCSPATVNLTDPSIIAGSTEGLIYSFWLDVVASLPYNTPTAATEGTYYIKGTTTSGCSDIKSVVVTVLQQPVSDAGPDQILQCLFNTNMDANVPGENLTGGWSFISGSGYIADTNYAKTTVSNLAVGENILLWAVNNGVCPPSLDYISITVHDLIIPTLITPDNNGLNDYFVLNGLESLGRTSLTIIDRRGVLVFENPEYDNKWDGVDYNGNPIPDDTYFFILRPENRVAVGGYIVVRR